MRMATTSFLEGVFPVRCVGCDLPFVWLCASCEGSCVFLHEACPVGRSTATLSRIFACSWYAHPVWQRLIRAIKFEQIHELTPILIRLVTRWRDAHTEWSWGTGAGYTLVGIPTNPRHIQERGRDHAMVWYQVMQSLLPEAVSCFGLVRREESSEAHARLTLEASRLAAAREVFTVAGPVPERVILCDDVYTTGATMQTLARQFVQRGAREVGGLVAAWAGGGASLGERRSVANTGEIVYE